MKNTNKILSIILIQFLVFTTIAKESPVAKKQAITSRSTLAPGHFTTILGQELQKNKNLPEEIKNKNTKETIKKTNKTINIDEFNKKLQTNLKTHVKEIASNIGPRNINKYPENLEKTKKYIIKNFKDLGYETTTDDFKAPNHNKKSPKFEDVSNIIATVKGTELHDEEILITAHYDSCQDSPGADGNASGVAALLEIARFMANKKPKRTIKFIAFANKEKPYYRTQYMGSKIYAEKARKNGDNIKAVINLDMIGYYTDKKTVNHFKTIWKHIPYYLRPLAVIFFPIINITLKLFFSNKGNYVFITKNKYSKHLAKKLIKSFKKHTDFPIRKLPFQFNGYDTSDHHSFWEQYYPAILATDTGPFRNPNYHKLNPDTDTPNTLDYEAMTKVVKGFAGAIKDLSDTNNINRKQKPHNTAEPDFKKRKQRVFISILYTSIILGITLSIITGMEGLFIITGLIANNIIMIYLGVGLFALTLFVIALRVIGFSALDILLILPGYYIKYTPHAKKSLKKISDPYISFKTSDGINLKGKYFRAYPDNPNKKPKGVLLFCHGNSGHIEVLEEQIQFFIDLGFDAFMYDHRGFSRHNMPWVIPSEAGLYMDAEAAYKKTKELYQEQYDQELESKKIVIAGHSLGANIANYLAHTREAGAFISIAGLTNSKDMIRCIIEDIFNTINGMPIIPDLIKYTVFSFINILASYLLYPILHIIIVSKFDALKRIKNINMPKFILHHVDDKVIPYSQGQALALEAQAADPKNTVFHTLTCHTKSYHSDLPVLFKNSEKQLVEFLKKHISKDIQTKEPEKQIEQSNSDKTETTIMGKRKKTNNKLSEFNKNLQTNLKTHVQEIAGKIGPRNITKYPEKLKDTKKYIKDKLKALGYDIKTQSYEAPNYDKENPKFEKVSNIIATLKGTEFPDEEILVTAHYDTHEDTPGADDNTSAVAGLLEIARFMKDKKPKRTIKFVAFANEEPPYYRTEYMGSKFYAKNARKQGHNIKAVINLEMIGYYSDKKTTDHIAETLIPSHAPKLKFLSPIIKLFAPIINFFLKFFISTKGNYIFIEKNSRSKNLTKTIMKLFKKHSDFPIYTLPSTAPYNGWSDHKSFWDEYYPAIMVTDTAVLRNPHYHDFSPDTDTPETLDYKSMTKVVNGFAGVVKDLSNLDNINKSKNAQNLNFEQKRKQVFNGIKRDDIIKNSILIALFTATFIAGTALLIPGIISSSTALIIIGSIILVIPAFILAQKIIIFISTRMAGVFTGYFVRFRKSRHSATTIKEPYVAFKNSDNITLKGLYMQAYANKKPKGVILYCHGNTGQVEHEKRDISYFTQRGYDVFLYDYRGFSKHNLPWILPSEKGLYKDAEAAYEEMFKQYKKHYNNETLDPKKTVIVGHSLGTAVANYLAYTKEAGAFISVCGFTNINAMRKSITKLVVDTINKWIRSITRGLVVGTINTINQLLRSIPFGLTRGLPAKTRLIALDFMLFILTPIKLFIDFIAYIIVNPLIYLSLTQKFDAINRISNITMPKLIIHHERDPLIPIKQGKKLAQKAYETDYKNTNFISLTSHEIKKTHQNLYKLLKYSEPNIINFIDKSINPKPIEQPKILKQYSGVKDEFKHKKNTPADNLDSTIFPGKIEINFENTPDKKFKIRILSKLPLSNKMEALCNTLEHDLNAIAEQEQWQQIMPRYPCTFIAKVSDLKGPITLAENSKKIKKFYLHGLLFDVQNKINFNLAQNQGRNSLLFSVLLQTQFNESKPIFTEAKPWEMQHAEKDPNSIIRDYYKKLFSCFEKSTHNIINKKNLIHDMQLLEKTVLTRNANTPTGQNLHSYSDFLELTTFGDNTEDLDKKIRWFLETQMYS